MRAKQNYKLRKNANLYILHFRIIKEILTHCIVKVKCRVRQPSRAIKKERFKSEPSPFRWYKHRNTSPAVLRSRASKIRLNLVRNAVSAYDKRLTALRQYRIIQVCGVALNIRFKRGHQPELEKIIFMAAVNVFLFFGVVNYALADVTVKLGVGKAQIFLVGFAAKSVDGSFVNKLRRKSQKSADRLYFLNRKV